MSLVGDKRKKDLVSYHQYGLNLDMHQKTSACHSGPSLLYCAKFDRPLGGKQKIFQTGENDYPLRSGYAFTETSSVVSVPGHSEAQWHVVGRNGEELGTLVLEVKGYDDRAEMKAPAAKRWCAAVNTDHKFGRWHFRIARNNTGEVTPEMLWKFSSPLTVARLLSGFFV